MSRLRLYNLLYRASHPHGWVRVALALAVAAVALALRLRAAQLLPIDYDEDDYLRAGQQMATAIRAGDWASLTELNYRTEHPPLGKLVFGVALAALPPAEEIPDRPTSAPPATRLPQPHLRTARTVAAVVGAIEVLLLALISPLAGLLLAIHTFTIKYTSQVMLEALPALTSAVALVTYSQGARRAQSGLNRWHVVSAIALGLTASSKYLYCVVGLVIVIDWLWQTRPDRQPSQREIWQWLWPLGAWGAVVIAAFLASNPYLWPDPVGRLKSSLLYHGGYATSEEVQQAAQPFWQPLVWATSSVPWHPGVFVLSLDGLIGMLALLGLPPARKSRPLYLLWLVMGMAFLLLWPTKWAQYIVSVTFPLALVAAEGVEHRLVLPSLERICRPRQHKGSASHARTALRREGLHALPWLLPGAAILLLIALYPLGFQAGIAMTDFSATSIKDGIQGGITREVLGGLSGEVAASPYDAFAFSRSTGKEVHFTGILPFLQVLAVGSGEVLVFEVVWTALSLGLQMLLGLAVALLLYRIGGRSSALWQALLILPWAIPEAVGALIWAQIFDPRYGWLYLGAKTFSETPGLPLQMALPAWQNSPNLALGVMLTAGTWAGFPLIMLAASASLKLIPSEVFDAAEMDGAGGLQRFAYITWPLLLPLLTPALMIRGILAFNQFYLFHILQPPYPLMTLAGLSYYIFSSTGKYATSALVNILTVGLLVIALLSYNRLSEASEGVTYA